ncbi:MAG: hypothetical protein GY906_04645 [bacterium]|nr:hypothetical protein [bacterium]
MTNQILAAAARFVAKANDNDSLIPELWSREALMTLMSNTVMAGLVHRDFTESVASYGDVVNTSRPADFSGKRKTDSDNVTDQDAVSPNIPVPLDQHFHVSYVIKDGELSKALPDLLDRYMEPAARELAEKVDQILCGQSARLMENQVGQPGAVTSLNVDDYILDADEKLNDNKCPKAGRRLVMSSRFNRAALGADIVVEADKRGDEGTALREASVGRIYGFDSFMDQNVAHVNLANAETATGATDAAGSETDTAVATDVPSADVTLAGGEYVVIDGDDYLHRISSAADSAGDTDITLVEGLKSDVPSGADVTVFKAADVNGAYVAGWAKEVTIDGYAANKGPQVGQLVSFGTGASTHSYTIIAVTDNSTTEADILLDRPLQIALADNDLCYPGPSGSRSIAFVRDAIALVSRPLATAANTMGARSAVTSFDGLSMRVTMQYDSLSQGTRVTFDLLCGVAILDARLACVING